MSRWILSLALLFLVTAGNVGNAGNAGAVAAMGTEAADDLPRLRGMLARATGPAKRAKITVKIGRVLLKQARRLYREGAYTDAEERLDEYVMAITAAYDELNATGIKARKHPSGFKELEIHLRKSRRVLRDLARSLPIAVRPAVNEAAKKVRTMRTGLLHALMAIDPPADGTP